MSGTTPRRSGPGGGALTKKEGPHPLAHSDEGWSHSQAIGACPMPFSFASVRARTQDQRDILKWGALSLPIGPTPTRGGPTHSQTIGACPLPFSFASMRARTQDQRDILKWGALSLPTELVAQLVVRVLPISICPFGLGFELSRRRKKRAWDMPL